MPILFAGEDVSFDPLGGVVCAAKDTVSIACSTNTTKSFIHLYLSPPRWEDWWAFDPFSLIALVTNLPMSTARH